MQDLADESGDRTERPTERRRREARARGDVARSSDLVVAIVLLAAGIAFGWLAPRLNAEFAGMLRSSLTSVPAAVPDAQSAAMYVRQIMSRVAMPVLAMLLAIVGAAATANLIQSGFLWIPETVMPQWKRLDPGRALLRWWSLHAWYSQLAGILKLAVLLGVLAIYLRTRLASAGALMEGTPQVMFHLAGQLLGECAMLLAVSLLLLAIADYGYQFWRFERSLMMTVEEVRRERMDDEPDPNVKRRQRELTGQ